MVAAAAQVLSSANHARAKRVESPTVFTTLSLIPILGAVPSYLMVMSLVPELKVTREAPRLIELISIKNQYIAIDGVRCLLTLACVAAGLFTKIILIKNLICFSYAGYALVHFCRIYKNIQVMDQLKTSGWEAGLKIY